MAITQRGLIWSSFVFLSDSGTRDECSAGYMMRKHAYTPDGYIVYWGWV